MFKPLFLGMSAMFFIAYALVAHALLVPDQQQLDAVTTGCITEGEGADQRCISDDPAVKIPIIGPIIEAAASIISVAATMFSQFFQLITFKAEGLGAASIITAIIFVPLGFINGFIIFTAIRGSS